jgi:small-conductance mechanosensitive channel
MILFAGLRTFQELPAGQATGAGNGVDMLKRLFSNPLTQRLTAVIVGLVIIVTIVRLLQRTLSRAIKDTDSRYRTRKAVTFLGYGLSTLLVLAIFSDSLGQMTVAFGVAGAGIAFALQEVIASVAGWIAVSLGGFYRIGDRVQLGGITGDVIDIGMLRTTMMETGAWVAGDLYNGRVVRVANSFVFKEPVYNYSGDFPFLWDEVRVPIKYGSDWRSARDMLDRVTREVIGDYPERAAEHWTTMLRQYRLEEATLEPIITLQATDNWLEFTIRYVVDYKKRRMTKHHLFTRILEELDASGGRIGIASATFQLVEAPRLDVRLMREPV